MVRNFPNEPKFRTNGGVLMVNRLVSNMYIVDSEQITRPLAYGVSAAICTTANVGKMKVSSVIFMAMTTASQLKIAIGDTSNIVLDYTLVTAGTGTVAIQRTLVDHFGYSVPWKSVFIPVITAATAVLVLD
jgi:hypothetical protein